MKVEAESGVTHPHSEYAIRGQEPTEAEKRAWLWSFCEPPSIANTTNNLISHFQPPGSKRINSCNFKSPVLSDLLWYPLEKNYRFIIYWKNAAYGFLLFLSVCIDPTKQYFPSRHFQTRHNVLTPYSAPLLFILILFSLLYFVPSTFLAVSLYFRNYFSSS
jgi:hypothetical protein